ADRPLPMDMSVEAQPGPEGVELEKRVRRLEEEISVLKDTRALEDRVVERVAERLQTTALAERFTATPPAQPARHPLPYTEDVSARAARDSYAWLLWDMFADARWMFLMFRDRRYAMAWTTHLVVWLCVPAILTSGWWFPVSFIPFVGHFGDK